MRMQRGWLMVPRVTWGCTEVDDTAAVLEEAIAAIELYELEGRTGPVAAGGFKGCLSGQAQHHWGAKAAQRQ